MCFILFKILSFTFYLLLLDLFKNIVDHETFDPLKNIQVEKSDASSDNENKNVLSYSSNAVQGPRNYRENFFPSQLSYVMLVFFKMFLSLLKTTFQSDKYLV